MAVVIVSAIMIAGIVGTYLYCLHQADSECSMRIKREAEER